MTSLLWLTVDLLSLYGELFTNFEMCILLIGSAVGCIGQVAPIYRLSLPVGWLQLLPLTVLSRSTIDVKAKI